MKIRKENLWIYIVGLIISIVLLGLYFIDTTNPLCIMSCSIGASGIGAVILAALIENSNEKHAKKTVADFRENKLYALKFELLFLLISTIECYFKMKFEILNEPNGDKCHRITYDELLIELQAQCQKWKKIIKTKEGSNIEDQMSKAKDLYYDLSARYDYFEREFKNKETEFKNYEAVGIFSTQEVDDIFMAVKVSHFILYDEYELHCPFVKKIFDCFINIHELSYFKDIVFYYKNQKAYYIIQGQKQLASQELTQEDIDNAVKSTDRI